MKLLRIPYLALMEILKQMEYEELFLMSFLSKRMMRIIQSIRRKELTDIEVVTFGCFLKFCAGIEKIVIVALDPESFASDKTLRKGTTLGNLVCSMEHKQRGLFRRYYPSLTIYFPYSEMNTMVTMVYNRLNALFGYCVSYTLNIRERYDALPTFLKNKRSEMYFDKRLNAQVLDNYFMNTQEHEYLKISFEGLIGNLSSNSRFHNTQELDITCRDRSFATDVLSNFNGKQLTFHSASGIENEICQFISRWKSSQELKNFESMRIFTILPGFVNNEDIKRKSGFKDLTLEQKAFGKRTHHSSYVVRDDGIMAKTHINRFVFSLEVQNFTEEQMLKGTEVTV